MLYGSGGTSLAQYHDMRYVHTAFEQDRPAAGFDAGELEEVTEDCLYAGRHYYFNSEVHGMHYGEFANYADHFARALIDGRDASPGLEEGVETVCVMEAARRSVAEARPIQLAELVAGVGLA
jgi:predicted dehydrogenase